MRFGYVKYNESVQAIKEHMKSRFETLAGEVEVLADGRSKALALTKLEEAYMWVGKALRDQQLASEKK